MDRIGAWNVARRFEKRSLLIAINAVAGLSIFFFGYDQGVMGGVNGTRDYAETMGFGHWDEAAGLVHVDKTLLEGGIVSHGFFDYTISPLIEDIGCCLLFTRDSFRCLHRWMVR